VEDLKSLGERFDHSQADQVIEIHNYVLISMRVILMIVVFSCRWHELHIRIPEIGIHCMTFVFHPLL